MYSNGNIECRALGHNTCWSTAYQSQEKASGDTYRLTSSNIIIKVSITSNNFRRQDVHSSI